MSGSSRLRYSLGSVRPRIPCAGPIRGTRRRGLHPRLEPDSVRRCHGRLVPETHVPAPSPGTAPLRRRPDGRRRGAGAVRHANRRGDQPRSDAQSADVWACGSATGSTGPLLSSSASESSSNSGRFSGFIFRTSSSISLPGLNVTTFFDGTYTLSPVRGFRALRGARCLTSKTPKFRSSIRPSEHQRLDDRVEGPLDDVLGLELSQTDILGNLLDNFFLGHDGDLHGAWSARSGQRMAQVYWWLRVDVKKKTPSRGRRSGGLRAGGSGRRSLAHARSVISAGLGRSGLDSARSWRWSMEREHSSRASHARSVRALEPGDEALRELGGVRPRYDGVAEVDAAAQRAGPPAPCSGPWTSCHGQVSPSSSGTDRRAGPRSSRSSTSAAERNRVCPYSRNRQQRPLSWQTGPSRATASSSSRVELAQVGSDGELVRRSPGRGRSVRSTVISDHRRWIDWISVSVYSWPLPEPGADLA